MRLGEAGSHLDSPGTLTLTFSMKYLTKPAVPESSSLATTENTTEPTGRVCKKELFTCVFILYQPRIGPSGGHQTVQMEQAARRLMAHAFNPGNRTPSPK